MDGPNNNMGIN